MEILKVRDKLFNQLQEFGAIKWHKSSYGSCYIKFKDTRLGSIRISDHEGRQKYTYKYEVHVNGHNISGQIDAIVKAVKEKTESLHGFDPERFIVWSNLKGMYEEVPNFQEYKKRILKKEE